jgi:hypothetical protein
MSKTSLQVILALLAMVVIAQSIVLFDQYDDLQVLQIDTQAWKASTSIAVKLHNGKHPLHKQKVEEMTSEKLKSITDPCTIWDWRERSKDKEACYLQNGL